MVFLNTVTKGVGARVAAKLEVSAGASQLLGLGVCILDLAVASACSFACDDAASLPRCNLGVVSVYNGRFCILMQTNEPCKSVKDRIGKNMIEDAEKKGLIKAGPSLTNLCQRVTASEITLSLLLRSRLGCQPQSYLPLTADHVSGL